MWNSIVMPESSGNPNAVNPAGYRGLGQTKESWGTGSVADQTKGMLNYAKQRYGSEAAALEFRKTTVGGKIYNAERVLFGDIDKE